MKNWKFHLKCLVQGLVLYAVVSAFILGFCHLMKDNPKIVFITLLTPLVLLGAYAWGKGLEGK